MLVVVIVGCFCFWLMLLLDVIVGCCCWLLLLVVVGGYCWLLLVVVVGFVVGGCGIRITVISLFTCLVMSLLMLLLLLDKSALYLRI